MPHTFQINHHFSNHAFYSMVSTDGGAKIVDVSRFGSLLYYPSMDDFFFSLSGSSCVSVYIFSPSEAFIYFSNEVLIW